MSSKNLIDPELLKFCGGEPPTVHLSADSLASTRIYLEEAAKSQGSESLNAAVEMSRAQLEGFEVLFYRPRALKENLPGVLHLHGGGFVMGSALMDEGYCKQLALDVGCVVVSVNYRLAPETRFPGALEDCYKALLWMNRESARLGVDTSKIAVMGESAGGGLAASLAAMVRDRGEIYVALQFLTYPMLDDRDPPAAPVLGEFVWTRGSNKFSWESYLGPRADSPYPAVPARISDLEGLAPAYIACGALDFLVVENLAYAQRLAAAGVPVDCRVFAGATHGFVNAVGTRLVNDYFAERKRVFAKAFGG